MRVIPVLDLLDGKVVHGVSGEREKYKPIDSDLIDSADPLPVASKFEEMGFGEIYVADLNAIQGDGENIDFISRIASETQLSLMVDAGFRNSEGPEPYVEGGVDKLVLATETLGSLDVVKEVRAEYPTNIVASVDLKGDEVIAESQDLRRPFPELVRGFKENGTSEIILLNLEKVGSSTGPDIELVERGLRHVKNPVLIGGGVRNVQDLISLREVGAAGALVATALHDRSIEVEDLEDL